MILIVDDKIQNITALKKILEAHQFVVDTALSGEEALRKILKNDYRLVVLDVQMPVMDGFEVAEAVSGISRTSDLPIIFLSAVNISKEFIKKGYASGGHDYLVKPFDPDILVLKIRTFVKLREQANELARIQEELRTEIEHRKQAEEKKDEFISIASHELKTPLTSVKGYMQLAEMSVRKDRQEDALQLINRAGAQLDKLNKLITELLDVAKIESGKLDFNLTEFNFDRFTDNVIDIFSQANPGWRIMRNGNADVTVRADELRMEQVLFNYLSNAAKYSHDTDTIYLDIRLLSGEELEVRVTDTGIGIDEQEQALVFKKFYRTAQSSNQYRGLGMGLYICAEIIQHHGGRYGVDSQPGKGSTFYFTLPYPSVNQSVN